MAAPHVIAADHVAVLGPAPARESYLAIDRVIDAVLAEMNRPGPFDFGDRAFVGTLREEAEAILRDRASWHLPPADTLFVQRKVSGTALLAARLKARVDVRGMVERYRSAAPGP